MAEKVYTTGFKDEACKLLTDDGQAPAAAARKLGVAEMTGVHRSLRGADRSGRRCLIAPTNPTPTVNSAGAAGSGMVSMVTSST